MRYTLRPYQQDAVNVAVNWMRKNSEPALLELATGAGKSLICAEIAKILVGLSKKKVLCLCPTSELVEQNYEKYLLTGNKASVYSASSSFKKQAWYQWEDVVFATEGTFKTQAEKVGSYFSCVILDECHKITPTIKKIINDMRIGSPNLRTVGMSATPYRMLTGYIYAIDENNRLLNESETIDPYFRKKLISIDGKFLTDQGFLTPITVGKIGAEQYNTSSLVLKNGKYTPESLDEAFVGKGQKTADIVADIVHNANGRMSTGVMIFGATIDHCYEIMESLPAYNSAMVTGNTPKEERKQIIKDYKDKKIKYLVNVSVLTTGFDAPHTDIIATLRRSESLSLIEQIKGRGARLYDGKKDYLWLCYAGNIDEHYPDGNIYNPVVKTKKSKSSVKHEVTCPDCHSVNSVTMRPNPDGYNIDQFGYFLDLAGERVEYEGQHFPAHFSRRCSHVEVKGHNVFERCGYYWSYKECTECGEKNDLTARKCTGCGVQLIDPNQKLIAEFKAFKKDLSQVQTDAINFIRKKNIKTKSGNDGIQISFGTPERIVQVIMSNKVMPKFYDLFLNTDFAPKTITYKKSSSGYMHIYDFNRETDIEKFNRENQVA